MERRQRIRKGSKVAKQRAAKKKVAVHSLHGSKRSWADRKVQREMLIPYTLEEHLEL